MPEPVERRELREVVAEFQKELAAGRRAPDLREKPTFVQWAGFRLVWAILGLIALLALGLLVYLAVAMPSIDAFGDPVTAESLAFYQKASDLVFERVTTLLDQVVIKTLVPVLTLLLGYVFGTRAGQAPPPDEGSP